MSDELQVSIFHFIGRTQLLTENQNEKLPYPKASNENEIVSNLNESSEQIAQQIETEIKRVLPPFITAQVVIQFLSGSILMECTVALFAWAGTTIFKAGKEEIEKQLGEATKVVIQRVLSRFFNSQGISTAVAPMNIVIAPQSMKSESEHVLVSNQQVIGQRNPLITTTFIITIIILLIQMILVLDRFFAITVKP